MNWFKTLRNKLTKRCGTCGWYKYLGFMVGECYGDCLQPELEPNINNDSRVVWELNRACKHYKECNEK